MGNLRPGPPFYSIRITTAIAMMGGAGNAAVDRLFQ
jgi:hypothetical protein